MLGTVCPFETPRKRLSIAAVSYSEERNPQVQWRQDVNAFTPKCLTMYNWASLRNANRSINNAFIIAIQDTLLAPDFLLLLIEPLESANCLHLFHIGEVSAFPNVFSVVFYM